MRPRFPRPSRAANDSAIDIVGPGSFDDALDGTGPIRRNRIAFHIHPGEAQMRYLPGDLLGSMRRAHRQDDVARLEQRWDGTNIFQLSPARAAPRTGGTPCGCPQHPVAIAAYSSTHRRTHSAWMHESNAMHVSV